jgi:hypothetical protein
VRRYLILFSLLLSATPMVQAQAAAKPSPAKVDSDVLIFANRDQLTGKLKSVTAGKVIFDSEVAGEVSISIDKIKELRSGAEFAL